MLSDMLPAGRVSRIRPYAGSLALRGGGAPIDIEARLPKHRN